VNEPVNPPEATAPGRPKRGAKRTVTLHWVRSGICTPVKQKATLHGLGFRRLGQRVVRPDDSSIRGMVRQVRHLVEIVKD
jgi:large subunit ribosomal protein L30